ncbi:hypothetical protein EC968_009494 [Mortierella alpina]|nr:hypothetical protein EC968_009494 [Mortierella alpina]
MNQSSSNPLKRMRTPTSPPRRGQPRLCERRVVDSGGSSVPVVHQQTVFAIPELLALVTAYLDNSDLCALIRVCRAWNALWISHLYATLSLHQYKGSRVYPRVDIYGSYVRTLTLRSTKWNNVLHLLDYTPNVSSLNIQRCPISSAQFQEIIAMVPRLRTFTVLFGDECVEMSDCPLPLVSMLPELEELSWKSENTDLYGDYSKVLVEDILLILKSCTKLRLLRLANVFYGTEELTNLELVPSIEDKVWQSRSLRLLEFDNVLLLGICGSYEDAARNLLMRRLFRHAPNLRTFKFTGVNLPCYWTGVFESAVNLEHVELWPHDKPIVVGEHIGDLSEAVVAMAASCSNLKVLNTQYAYSTTDECFESLMRSNRQLQRLCVKRTGFGDRSLKELLRTPSVPSAMCTPADHLVYLDLEGCHQVTSAGALPVLENCRFLQGLNLAGTRAGTLELFNGSKSWACVESLEALHIDIQPIGFQPPSSIFARLQEEKVSTPSTVQYSMQEHTIIRERLHSLRMLTVLELRGGAMDFAIVDEASFAPRLRMLNITVPCRDQQDPSPSSQYSLMLKRVKEIGSRLLPAMDIRLTGTITAGGRVAWMISVMMDVKLMGTSILWRPNGFQQSL